MMAWPSFRRVRNVRVVFRGKGEDTAGLDVIEKVQLNEMRKQLDEVKQDLAFLITYPTQEAVQARIGRLSKAVALGAEIVDPVNPFTADSPGEELLKLLAHARRRGYIKEEEAC